MAQRAQQLRPHSIVGWIGGYLSRPMWTLAVFAAIPFSKQMTNKTAQPLQAHHQLTTRGKRQYDARRLGGCVLGNSSQAVRPNVPTSIGIAPVQLFNLLTSRALASDERSRQTDGPRAESALSTAEAPPSGLQLIAATNNVPTATPVKRRQEHVPPIWAIRSH